MPVKQEKVRMFLLREQEFIETEIKDKEYEDKLSAYEGLLMDCKDGIQVSQITIFYFQHLFKWF